MAHGDVLIGLGSGRCGTATLAGLLARQSGVVASHELRGARLAWQGGERELDAVLDELARRLTAGARLAVEVGFYYLPYVARIRARFPAARFVVLKRERATTIESFLAQTRDKSNHWAPTSRFARRARWNHCFPTYDAGLPKAEAIGRYWDEYYAATAALGATLGDALLTLSTETLDAPETQRVLLDFAGVPRAAQVLEPGLRLNRAERRDGGLRRRLARLIGR